MSRAKPRNKTYCIKTGIDLHDKIKKGQKFLVACHLKERKNWRGVVVHDAPKSETLVDGRIYQVEERWVYTDGQVKYKIKGSNRHYHSSKFRQLDADEMKRLERQDKIKKLFDERI